MNVHPITTPASPFPASPLLDALCDSIESLTNSFTSTALPTLETTTVTEVAFGYHRNQQFSITAMTTSSGAVAERYAYNAYGQPAICNASDSPIGNLKSPIASLIPAENGTRRLTEEQGNRLLCIEIFIRSECEKCAIKEKSSSIMHKCKFNDGNPSCTLSIGVGCTKQDLLEFDINPDAERPGY
jgi:hypothetical protein